MTKSQLAEMAEKVYQSWCEIDTPRSMLHKRLVTDIEKALIQAHDAAIEKAAKVCGDKIEPDYSPNYFQACADCERDITALKLGDVKK